MMLHSPQIYSAKWQITAQAVKVARDGGWEKWAGGSIQMWLKAKPSWKEPAQSPLDHRLTSSSTHAAGSKIKPGSCFHFVRFLGNLWWHSLQFLPLSSMRTKKWLNTRAKVGLEDGQNLPTRLNRWKQGPLWEVHHCPETLLGIFLHPWLQATISWEGFHGA